MWDCSECCSKVDAIKKISVIKLPNIMIICLKRFKTISFPIYNNDNVEIRTELTKNMSTVDFELEDLNMSYVFSNFHPRKNNLFSIINHIGSTITRGHYTTFGLNFLNKKWYEYDDEKVLEITDKNKLITKNAYILFYSNLET
jgi:hypothetical protein